ncbi:MAG TPA: helix-turn-helix transcriptional regulator [Hanamia sp.]|nr:helix-turn-helix transcriptional regulator [Hanamia sp.]
MKKEKKNDNVDKELSTLLALMKFDNKEQKLRHDAFILMAGYLSEIEAIQEKHKITKKELAKRIGNSASYLTQIFRGNKPLNFYTIAKIKNELNIKFEVRAIDLNEKFTKDNNEYFPVSSFDLSDTTNSNTLTFDQTKIVPIEQVKTLYSF